MEWLGKGDQEMGREAFPPAGRPEYLFGFQVAVKSPFRHWGLGRWGHSGFSFRHHVTL